MAKVNVYKQNGEIVGQIELNPKLFDVAPKEVVVHEAILAQENNSRQVIAHTKGRGEVRGGGRKPWKQKGTGRARHGSIRSPLWKGGGVTFGPTNIRNFAVGINKKKKRQALSMALTDKVRDEKFIVLDSFELPEAKTKLFSEALSKLPAAGAKRLLVVVDPKDEVTKRVTRNLPNVTAISGNSLNVRDLVISDYVLTAKDAVNLIEQTYVK